MIGYSTITQKGQITIPSRIRQELGLKQGKRVVIMREANGALIKSVPDFFSLRGSVKTNKKLDIDTMRKSAKEFISKRYSR